MLNLEQIIWCCVVIIELSSCSPSIAQVWTWRKQSCLYKWQIYKQQLLEPLFEDRNEEWFEGLLEGGCWSCEIAYKETTTTQKNVASNMTATVLPKYILVVNNILHIRKD